MSDLKRVMPDQVKLGKSFSTVMMQPMSNYKEYLENPEKMNPHGLRTVMGYCLPEWQRGSVWTQEQKVSFIKSCWLGINIGTYSYNYASIGSKLDNLLIDGQQRLTAIEEYINDKFHVFDFYWSETTVLDKRLWNMNITFASYQTETDDEQYLKDYYNLMNFGGTAHKGNERA